MTHRAYPYLYRPDPARRVRWEAMLERRARAAAARELHSDSVPVTPCATIRHSHLVPTRHGMVRVETVHPLDNDWAVSRCS